MSVAWDSTGTGNRTTGSSTTLGTSWSHTISSTGTNTCVIVGVDLSGSDTAIIYDTVTVTYGSTVMSNYYSLQYGSSGNRGTIAIYYLWDPPGGAQTVSVTTSGTSTKTAVAGCSVAYTDVGSLNWMNTANAKNVTITSDTSSMAWAMTVNGAALSAPNMTSRYAAGSLVTGLGDYIQIQDAAGAASVAFTNGGTATTARSVGLSISPTGRNYYVAASGSDSNVGTDTGHPWQTLWPAAGQSVWGPGSTLSYNGGDTFTGSAGYYTGGTSSSPATINSYGTGKAILSNTSVNITMYFENCGGVAVDNLIIDGPGITNTSAGIGFWFYNGWVGDYARITNCEIKNSKVGINLGCVNYNSGLSNVTIDNCLVHDNWSTNLEIYGDTNGSGYYSFSNYVVSNSQFYNSSGKSTITNATTGNGALLWDIDTLTVQNCSFFNNGPDNGYSSDSSYGLLVATCKNATISDCLAYNNTDNTTEYPPGFYIFECEGNNVIEYCVSYNNGGSGIGIGLNRTGATTTARYNLCWGNNTYSTYQPEMVSWQNNAGTTLFYNNTLVARDSTTDVIGVGQTSSGVKFYNNIIYADIGRSLISTNTTYTSAQVLFAGNLYYSSGTFNINWNGTSYGSVAAWRAGVSGEEYINSANTGITANPQLNDASTSPTTTNPTSIGTTADVMKIQGGSPAFQKGIDYTTLGIGSPGSRDYWGNAINTGGPSIGGHVPNPFFNAF